MNKFEQYIPEKNPLLGMMNWDSLMYLRNEDGVDWYHYREGMGKDTFKICHTDEGKIVSCYVDATMIWPFSLHVIEVDKVPDGFPVNSAIDGWDYLDGEIKPTPVDPMIAVKAEFNKRMHNASQKIEELLDEQAAGEGVEVELSAWRVYRAKLRKLWLTPTVVFPEVENG